MSSFSFQSKNRKAKSGNAITEYAVIGSLVLVGAIAGLTVLGISISKAFHDMVNNDPKVMAQQQAKMLQVAGTATQVAGNVSTGMTSASNASSAKAGTGASLQVTQTVGANGAEQVSNNSAALFALAKKYEQTNPTVSNVLITFGQKGQAMAQAIQAGDKANMSNLLMDFGAYYFSQVDPSGNPTSVMNLLSPQDQQLVTQLTKQSVDLTQAASGKVVFYSMLGSGTTTTVTNNAASQVNGNSTQTIQCGQNMQCN